MHFRAAAAVPDRLALVDLDEPAVRRYLDLRFYGHRFPPELAPRVHEHTDGQPLFVVALVNHLIGHGAILDTQPGWALSMPLYAIDFGVPEDVRRLLEGEFRDLSPSARRVLEAASAAGEHAVAAILAAALGWPVQEAEQVCETLARFRGEVTVLAVSHQTGLAEIADRVMRLDAGVLMPANSTATFP